MKVLQIQRFTGIAGSERYILALCKELIAQGIETEVLCILSPNDEDNLQIYFQLLEEIGIKYHVIYDSKSISFGLIKKIKSVIKTQKYDLVHAHLIYADVYAFAVKYFFPSLKLKIVSTKHGYNEKYYTKGGFINPYYPIFSIYYYLALFIERGIDKSYAVSKGIKRVYNFLKITGKDMPVIYNGIAVGEKSEIASKNNEVANEKNKIAILLVGRMAPLKGHAYLVQAINLLKNQYSSEEIEVVFLGKDSGAEQEIREQITRFEVEQYFTFQGFVEDVYSFYEKADIVIIPSKSEAFGLVFLEGFKSKKPIIAFDVPACNEIIENGVNGFLIPPFSIKDLADKIKLLIEQPAMRTKLGEQGYKTLVNRFSIEIMTKEIAQLYQSVK